MHKNTQIKISEISKDTKHRFKGIIQETSGLIKSFKCSTFFSKKIRVIKAVESGMKYSWTGIWKHVTVKRSIMNLHGGLYACSEDQCLWFRNRLTEKMTYSIGFALHYPKIIPCHASFRHWVTHVRWTIADEPESSVMCSQWCTIPAANAIFWIRNH